MTECQGCGAWNDTRRTLCVLCGTPLAETDEWDAAAELPPLPPLPDGGLAASMPTWLREPPASDAALAAAPLVDLVASAQSQPLTPLGPRADPRTFLSDNDFPRWLHDLAAREAEGRVPSGRRKAEGGKPGGAQRAPGAPDGGRTVPPPWPSWPDAAPDGGGRPGGAQRAPGAPDGGGNAPPASRRRDFWETLLLVLLFIGVVGAALWALVANGVFSPGV